MTGALFFVKDKATLNMPWCQTPGRNSNQDRICPRLVEKFEHLPPEIKNLILINIFRKFPGSNTAHSAAQGGSLSRCG
jgi:hypothetical protein